MEMLQTYVRTQQHTDYFTLPDGYEEKVRVHVGC